MLVEYIKSLPKAELHLHIEGSLAPELMFELASKNEITIKYQSVDEIRSAYNFHNLQSFLDIYYEGMQVLQTADDFYRLAQEYFKKCREDGVVHTEIFFDPQAHTARGIPFATIIQGLVKAQKEARENDNISSSLIMCFLRHLSEEDAYQTLEQALPYKEQIIAVGLDSSELGHPPSKFAGVFKKSRDEGFKAVAHAGEEGPCDYIWEALDLLKVDRIDHGVRCMEDPKLVEHLRQHQIPLTVCPLSNVKLKVFDQLSHHNLKEMYESGLKVTINSDDPSYFGGYINQNYLETANALDLSRDDLQALAKNSLESSFLIKSKD